MTLNTLSPIINISPTTRTGGSGGLGRFASKGFVVAVTPDIENPWIFSSFMVRTAGDVVVADRNNNNFLMPACQPGVQYFAVGIKIIASGTTATGIFVYGGV